MGARGCPPDVMGGPTGNRGKTRQRATLGFVLYIYSVKTRLKQKRRRGERHSGNGGGVGGVLDSKVFLW